MDTTEYLEWYNYATSSNYENLLMLYESYEEAIDSAPVDMWSTIDWCYAEEYDMNFGAISDQKRNEQYINLIRTYGARTEKSRHVLAALAKAENRVIITDGSLQHLDNGIAQAEKATDMEENDMGRLKERITLPSGVDVWVTGTTRAELVSNAIKAAMSYVSSSAVTPAEEKIRPTFEKYAWHWFDTYHVKHISKGTAKNDRSIMQKHLIPKLGKYRMNEITHDDIQHLFDSSTHLAQSSHKKIMNILRQVFQSALEDGHITKNVMESKRYCFSESKTERKPLCYDDLIDILNHLGLLSERERLYIQLLVYTGARRGEALALEWKDIDFTRKTVSITEAVHYDDGNTPTIGKTKSKAGVREVPLLTELEKVLMATKHTGRYIVGGDKLISETAYQKMWGRIKRTIDVHGATAHVFRHTFGSFACYMKGSNLKALQGIMGHSSIEVTMDIYCNAQEDREHKQQIEELFNGLWMEQKSDTVSIAC